MAGGVVLFLGSHQLLRAGCEEEKSMAKVVQLMKFFPSSLQFFKHHSTAALE